MNATELIKTAAREANATEDYVRETIAMVADDTWEPGEDVDRDDTVAVIVSLVPSL